MGCYPNGAVPMGFLVGRGSVGTGREIGVTSDATIEGRVASAVGPEVGVHPMPDVINLRYNTGE